MGTRIDGALRRAGMTQRELAERLHVDPAQVSRIVRGAMQRPSLELVCRMAEEMEVTVDSLVNASGASLGSPDGPGLPAQVSAFGDAEGGADGEADWRRVALALAEGDRLRAEAERLRAEASRLRVTEVDAAMQQNIRDMFRREAAGPARRDASSSRYAGRVEAAAGGAS